MALLESSFDQDAHVRVAMKYLEEKKVKTLLRDLTQSLLLAQPADPRKHILEELWETSETSGKCCSSKSLNAASAFLKTSATSARQAVHHFLRSMKDAFGDVQSLSFFSAPEGRGRRVLGLGDAQKLLGPDFFLVDSSDEQSTLGESGASLHNASSLKINRACISCPSPPPAVSGMVLGQVPARLRNVARSES